MVERYGVYWVNLDPVVGREISKRRPGVVVSDDDMNRILGTVVVCPVTSRLHPRWPSRIQTVIADREAEIAIEQIRKVDKSRIGDRIGFLDDAAAQAVRHVITMLYGVLSVDGPVHGSSTRGG